MDSNKRIRLWDRISELPDDILVSILSLLSLKEAGRTSVLSSRWRYLWKFFIGKMLFHYDEWPMSSPQLVTHINQIVRLHRGMSIKGFTIVLSDNVSSVEDIDHWFEFISKKRANNFELVFGHENPNQSHDHIYTRIHLQPLSANWNFESLKVVGLSRVNLIGGAGANAAMNGLLSNSPNLEHLYLNYLVGLSELFVPSSCLKLRELSMERCYGLRKLKILARNIQVFHCIGVDKDIEIEGLDQLPYLKFGDRRNKWRTLSSLMDHLYRILPMGQLEKLSLDMWKLEQRRPLGANRFGLLKLDKLQLTILPYIGGDEMFSWIYLLKAAPVLHTLEITFSWRDGFVPGLTTLDTYKMKSNRSIKVVRVEQFLGLQGYDKRVVKTLLKYVKSLEKLIVAPYKEPPSVWPPMPEEIMKEMKGSIAELHQDWFLPPGIELVIEGEP